MHLGGPRKEMFIPDREEAVVRKFPGLRGSASLRPLKLVQPPLPRQLLTPLTLSPWFLACLFSLVFILINALGDNLNC